MPLRIYCKAPRRYWPIIRRALNRDAYVPVRGGLFEFKSWYDSPLLSHYTRSGWEEYWALGCDADGVHIKPYLCPPLGNAPSKRTTLCHFVRLARALQRMGEYAETGFNIYCEAELVKWSMPTFGDLLRLRRKAGER